MHRLAVAYVIPREIQIKIIIFPLISFGGQCVPFYPSMQDSGAMVDRNVIPISSIHICIYTFFCCKFSKWMLCHQFYRNVYATVTCVLLAYTYSSRCLATFTVLTTTKKKKKCWRPIYIAFTHTLPHAGCIYSIHAGCIMYIGCTHTHAHTLTHARHMDFRFKCTALIPTHRRCEPQFEMFFFFF